MLHEVSKPCMFLATAKDILDETYSCNPEAGDQMLQLKIFLEPMMDLSFIENVLDHIAYRRNEILQEPSNSSSDQIKSTNRSQPILNCREAVLSNQTLS